MIITSLKSESQFLSGGGFSWLSWSTLDQRHTDWTRGPQLNDRLLVVDTHHFVRWTPGGFAFSKLRFRMSTVVFLVIVSAMMVPLQAILMPEFVNVTKLGLTGGYFGAILVYAALGRRFPYSSSRLTFAACPMSSSSGIVDGLGYFGVTWRLIVPIAVPAIATVTVLQFIQIWTTFSWDCSSSEHVGEDRSPSASAVLSAGRTTSIPALMAGSIVSAVPAMVVYLGFQRYLVKGLTMGIDR